MKCPVFGDTLDRTIGNNIIMDCLITVPQSLVQTIMMMMIIMIDECPRNTWNYVNTGMWARERGICGTKKGRLWLKLLFSLVFQLYCRCCSRLLCSPPSTINIANCNHSPGWAGIKERVFTHTEIHPMFHLGHKSELAGNRELRRNGIVELMRLRKGRK